MNYPYHTEGKILLGIICSLFKHRWESFSAEFVHWRTCKRCNRTELRFGVADE